MRYIVDFINTATENEIDSWLIQKNCQVVKQFNHFSKTYLVEALVEPSTDNLVEHVLLDDTSNSLKLLETFVAPVPYDSITIDTTSDQNWWKSLVFYNAINFSQARVNRIGAGYPVYVMDSGIKSDHPDLVGANIRNLFSFTSDFGDTKGHGTAIASLISGNQAGITNAELINVKIFQSGTSTLISDLLNGLDAVAIDYTQNYPNTPGVLNLSWGISANDFVEAKIKTLINLGIVVVAAAGNSGIPIGDVTPARMPEVLTIGSINSELAPSSFSNYTGESVISLTAGDTNHGPELDYWAPGEHIYVASIVDDGFSYAFGTSMSAGIVSATVVHNLARHNFMYNMEPITWTTDYSLTGLMTGTGQTNITIDTQNIKNLIAGANISIPSTNMILPSQALVQLSEKYSNCTNRIPVIRALSTDELKSSEDIKAENNGNIQWYRHLLFVNKGESQHIPFLNYGFVDSVTLTNLPAGLSLNGLYITGLMNDEVTAPYQLIPVSAEFIKGDKTLNTTIYIIYYDRTKIGTQYSIQDVTDQLNQDSLLTLFSNCYDCSSLYSCAEVCQDLYACDEFQKFYYQICGPL